MSLVPYSKITVPQLPPEFVLRAAQRADLDAGSSADITLVCAPAGYGKTVVLADWAQASTESDTGWVSLDRDDNDPNRLWVSVVAALAACPSVPPTSRLHAPWMWRPGAQPEFLAELTDAVQSLPRPVRLILDDVHELVDPVALHGLQTLMRNRPAGLRLVLSSRLDPPLSLPRLRLEGRWWELRADRLRFSLADAATLLERSGLRLPLAQIETLHQRTGGWAAGLRLAALAITRTTDRDAFLDQFSGNERSVADYLVGEILSRLPDDIQEFLRVISISDPVPSGLASELSGREEAGSLLDGLERQTSLLSSTGGPRDVYRIQELLRTYLTADLQRQGPTRAAALHAVAARWWAGQDRPIKALDHAAQSRNPALLSDLLRRFALPLILTGDHGPLRRALSTLGAQATASDPWLALTCALTQLEAGDSAAARAHLRHVRTCWPSHDTVELAILQAAVEQLTAPAGEPSLTGVATDIDELAAEPPLEALARLSRGAALLERDDRARARAELEAALELGRRHGFDYLSMQCQVLLAVIAGTCGEVRTMVTWSTEALAATSRHGWQGSTWSATATAMIAHAALLRADPPEAERLAAEGLALRSGLLTPPLRFALRVVHGAATFDQGRRANGLAELQQARSRTRRPRRQRRTGRIRRHPRVPRRTAGRALRRHPHRVQLAGRTHRPTPQHRHRTPNCWSCAPGPSPPPAAPSAPARLSARCSPAPRPHCSATRLVDAWLLETSPRGDCRRTARRPPRPAIRTGHRRAARRATTVRPGLDRRPRAARPPARQLRNRRSLRPAGARRGRQRRGPTHRPERAGTHRPRAAPVHALPQRDRHRPDRVGEHRQEPRPVHLP